jgi:hypothetical protein
MSTGLTYINILDPNPSAPDTESGTVIWSSYEEAYQWCDWFMRFRIASASNVYITIWTSGPNSNGYWSVSGGEPLFTSFD